jgi:hypothetical protein
VANNEARDICPASEEPDMQDRAEVIREMIGEYEYELSVARSRADNQSLRRGKLELAREALFEHGEQAEAERLQVEIRDLDHHIESSQALIEKYEGLIATYRRALEKMSVGA